MGLTTWQNSSITDDGTLVTLARSLRLVIIMEDLVKTNKPLKLEWESRRKNVLQLIRDIALVKLGRIYLSSVHLSLCTHLFFS
jgi:stearoyl-CoA desaturase (delta-9 desaturase)